MYMNITFCKKHKCWAYKYFLTALRNFLIYLLHSNSPHKMRNN